MLLHLVRGDYGSEVANKVARRLVVPLHRDGEQAQLVKRPVPNGDAGRIAPLLDWMREHIRSPHSVGLMASAARMSRRTFQRKFKESTGLAPLDWLVRERVALACDLLQERPGMAIELVAELAGFGSSESLRRHLRRLGQPSPTAQRQGPRPPAGSP
jgi:AraC family transcriptional activator FtrA